MPLLGLGEHPRYRAEQGQIGPTQSAQPEVVDEPGREWSVQHELSESQGEPQERLRSPSLRCLAQVCPVKLWRGGYDAVEINESPQPSKRVLVVLRRHVHQNVFRRREPQWG
jgi:hypothetical protein